MTDIVERLREFSGPQYPDDICGKSCMAEAAAEIERLRGYLEAYIDADGEVMSGESLAEWCKQLERRNAALEAENTRLLTVVNAAISMERGEVGDDVFWGAVRALKDVANES